MSEIISSSSLYNIKYRSYQEINKVWKKGEEMESIVLENNEEEMKTDILYMYEYDYSLC